jgi:uncharacterized Tic20 family protein
MQGPTHDPMPGPGWPATSAPGPYGVRAPAERVAGTRRPVGSEDQWAALTYFSAIFLWLLPPLVIYLAKRKASGFIRWHAAQSFNLTLTATLFAVSIGIIGAVLSLDSARASLVLMIPLLVALWIAMMVYLVRAASAASRGEFYEVPSWLCVRMLK